ncbi:MAG: hypothetical protein ACLUJE_02375 [Anaerococcus sp.]
MNMQSFVYKCFLLNNDAQQLNLFEDENFEETNLIACIIDCLKKQYKFNVCKWESPNRYYPQYMFLGGDKGILAYIVFQYYYGNTFSENEIKMPLNYTIKIVSYAESRLDRPVFFIKIFNYKDKVEVLFETSEQIKDRLWNEENSTRENNYISDISRMGDFANLKYLWDDLKKNSVKQY